MRRPRRRLPRILLNAATFLSLALFAGTVALWARGRSIVDQIEVGYWGFRPHRVAGYQDARMLILVHARGRVTIAAVIRACVAGPGFRYAGPGDGPQVYPSPGPPIYERDPARGERWTHARLTAAGLARADGWVWNVGRRTRRWVIAGVRCAWGPDNRAVAAPDWAIASALATLPACRAILARRRWHRRHRDSSCATCGYDLRATPNRCPECGAVPPPPAPPPPAHS